MEQLLETQQHVKHAQQYLSCHPWLPWTIPMVLYVAFNASVTFLGYMAEFKTPLPCTSHSIVLVCLLMSMLTLGMYRVVKIPRVGLFMTSVCILCSLHHMSVCAFVSFHLGLTVMVGIPNVLLQIQLLHGLVHSSPSDELRRTLWQTLTIYLPMSLVPQMCLAIIHLQ